MRQDNNNNNNNNNNKDKDEDKEKEKTAEEILAKESPELFLKLKEHEIEPRVSLSLFSVPSKLLMFIGIIDLIVGFLLSVITKKSHLIFLGSTGIWVSLPWWLCLLDGFIFIGYGVYVIKKKRGELDVGIASGTKFKVQEIKGEASSLLGLIYILLGIFLISIVIIRSSMQGIL